MKTESKTTQRDENMLEYLTRIYMTFNNKKIMETYKGISEDEALNEYS